MLNIGGEHHPIKSPSITSTPHLTDCSLYIRAMIVSLFFLHYIQRYACTWTLHILLLLLATCVFSVVALTIVQAYLIVPGCNLPILWATEFCRTVASQASYPPVTSAAPWVCDLPIIFRLPICSNAVRNDSFRSSRTGNYVVTSIEDQFHSYNQLVVGSATAPMFGRDIREVVLSLDDMVVLLKGSSFEEKDAIISQLLAIRHASRESAYRLQKCTSRLLSSINLCVSTYLLGTCTDHLKFSIMTASQSAIEAAQSHNSTHLYTKFLSKLTFWRSPTDSNQQLNNAFLHAIKTFEILGRDLYHLNGETQEAVSILDGHIEVLVDLVFHHLTGANKELGDVLSWFWTRLGGHRSILLGAKQ